MALERYENDPEMTKNGAEMGVPVVNDGLGKYCCQWCFFFRADFGFADWFGVVSVALL